MGWNWQYENGEKKYYKPKFDFPTYPTTLSTLQETSLKDTIDKIVTSVSEVVTEFVSEQSTQTTTPLSVQEITESRIIEAVTTVNSTILQEAINGTVISQDALTTTTESVISTDIVLGVEEAGATMLNEAMDNATTIPDVDWMDQGLDNMFFNHNLTMTHQEFEESSQKLYIMLGLILAVLIVILIFVFAVYNKYRKTTVYEMEEGCPTRKNKVISKTSEACYGNDSVLIESNEVENYKF